LYATLQLAPGSSGNHHDNRIKANVIGIVHDDNDVRKALLAHFESAGHCVDADRSRASLAAKTRIDEVACQAIEKCMPGMIGRDFIAALYASNLTIQTLLIPGTHESDILGQTWAQTPALLSRDSTAKQ
jgi:FixJ family two-component response regulator